MLLFMFKYCQHLISFFCWEVHFQDSFGEFNNSIRPLASWPQLVDDLRLMPSHLFTSTFCRSTFTDRVDFFGIKISFVIWNQVYPLGKTSQTFASAISLLHSNLKQNILQQGVTTRISSTNIISCIKITYRYISIPPF